jgi:hypothetical protein
MAIRTRELRVAGALMLGLAVTQPVWSRVLSGLGGVPCGLRWAVGVPCPLCGMTTSVCATVQGQFGDALAANPFGVVAVVVAVVSVVTGRWGRVWRVPSWVLWAGLGVSEVWQVLRVV